MAAADGGDGGSALIVSAAASAGPRASLVADSMEELLAGLGSHENVIEFTVTDATLAVRRHLSEIFITLIEVWDMLCICASRGACFLYCRLMLTVGSVVAS
jgi:hypothetical protein